MKKYSFLCLVSLLAGTPLASLAATDPSVTLFSYLENAFAWGIGLAALITGVSFAFGAVQYIFFAQSDGKDRMLNSVVGLFLCLASVVIIRQINPRILTQPNLMPLPSQGDIYLEKNDGKRGAAREKFEVSKALKDDGYTKLVYACQGESPAVRPRLIIITTLSSTTGDVTNFIEQKECDKPFTLPAPSTADQNVTVSYRFEDPGVYFYTSEGCSGKGDFTGPYTDSVSSFPANMAIKCMVASLGNTPDKGYYVVTTSTPDIIAPNDIKAFYLNRAVEMEDRKPVNLPLTDGRFGVASAIIIRMPDNPVAVGNSVSFYSKPNPWSNVLQQVEMVLVTSDKIEKMKSIEAKDMEFEWRFNPAFLPPSSHVKTCKTFRDCPHAVTINGQYAVFLETDDGSGLIIQKMFTETEDDIFRTDAFAGGYSLQAVHIIPFAR